MKDIMSADAALVAAVAFLTRGANAKPRERTPAEIVAEEAAQRIREHNATVQAKRDERLEKRRKRND